MKKRYRRSWIFFVAVFAAVVCTGCGKKTLKQFDVQYLDYFDTISSITIYAEDEKEFEQYRDVVEEELEHYHKLFDIYHNYDGIANVKTINDYAGTSPVVVEPELMELIQFSIDQCKVTDGRINIAMGSVLSIWHDYRENGQTNPGNGRVPDEVELERAAEHMDISQIQINEKTSSVFLPDERMSLDVGGVAKGFATHKLCEKLRELGVTSAILSIGGNVETIGLRGDGNPWRVGIQNPDISSPQTYLHVMELQDQALVTSGVYQRFFEVNGVRYHHIIHPDLLKPWNEYLSVTILCKDGGVADAFSTAVFNMELEAGQAFVESREDVEAMWILPDGEEVYSSGFQTSMSQ